MNRRTLLCMGVALAAALGASMAAAHEGHDHAASERAAPVNAVAITRVAQSPRHELVLRAPALHPGERTRLELYVSDWSTNAPVTGADVAIELRARETSGEPARGATQSTADGVYTAELALPPTGDYNVLVRVRSSLGSDEFALAAVRVEPPADPAGTRSPLLLLGGGAVGLVVLIAALAWWTGRRRARAAAAVLLLVGGAMSAAPALAHEGNDHVEPAPAAAPGGAVERVSMPKPSQFLLGVRTQVIALSTVPRQVALLGRVAPRGGAEADVVAPQAGRVDLLGRRVPVLGDRVARGQLLGHLVVVDSLAIRAPIAGQVTATHVVHGQRVEAGQKLVSLLDASTVWVHADVYERDLAAVERASRAVVTSDAWPGERFMGRRVALGASASELPGTVEGWFEVPNPRGRLRVGLPVSVAVELGGAEPLAVLPREAVLEDAGRATVWLHEAPETFVARAVQIVVRLGDRLAVRGLRPGERAVIAGAPAVAALPRLREEP